MTEMLQTILFGQNGEDFIVNPLANANELTVIEIDGRKWYKAKDIATTLGYKKARNAIERHVRNQDKMTWEQLLDRSPVLGPLFKIDPQTIFIKFSGVYDLMRKSKLPLAEQFNEFIENKIEYMLWNKPKPVVIFDKLAVLDREKRLKDHAIEAHNNEMAMRHTERHTNYCAIPENATAFCVQTMLAMLGYNVHPNKEAPYGLACAAAYREKYNKEPDKAQIKIYYKMRCVNVYTITVWIDFLLDVLHECSAKYKLKAIE
jgi:hypothetical protein